LKMTVKAYFPIPKSTRKKERVLMQAGKIRHTKKPDGDNVVKSIADALNGIAYDDDSAVVDLTISKDYSEKPRVEVEIEEIYG